MIVDTSPQALGDSLGPLRARGKRVGLVPTMGYLHRGHLSLVDLARREVDVLVASIFVNPLQFGPKEDLATYPRDLPRDLALLEETGVDLVFAPSVEDMYPGGRPEVTVDPGSLAGVLCGRYRPGHFRGVLTVVARLFGLVQPDLAVFGQKDYQQLALIRRMVADLAFPVEVRSGPIVREPDGLALSSRNVFLTPPERADAVGLFKGLRAVQKAVTEGTHDGNALLCLLREVAGQHPHLRLQYAEFVDPGTLTPVDRVQDGTVAAVAAYCGSTRLIDNHLLEVPSS